MNRPFHDVVESVEALGSLISPPSELVRKKALPHIDAHARAFIALSPMVLIGTHDASGHTDVSPRGDPAGFVRTLDERWIVIPERVGNRRVDTLRNIVQTGQVGLLFLVPGVQDTLRVNGRAWVVRDRELLDPMAVQGKEPLVGIAVEVQESYLHCARCMHRSKLWDSQSWPAPGRLPSLAQMLVDQVKIPDLKVEQLEAVLEECYTKELY